MLKKRYKWGIAISILLTGALLTGCSDYLEDTINPPSYHEMGYVVEGVNTYGNDINVVNVKYMGDIELYGVVDDDLKWTLIMTNTYGKLEYHEGLTKASIDKNEHDDTQLYGYLDKNGEWAIKSIYKYAEDFKNGVAKVKTFEGDKDNLSNSRTIYIDTKGKEIIDASNDEDMFIADDGYFHSAGKNGFYDKNGNFVEVPEEFGGNYYVLEGKIIDYSKVGQRHHMIYLRDYNGNIMKELTFPESDIDYAVGIYPNRKMFEVRNENNGSFLFDQEDNLLYESDKSISMDDNVVYEEESSVHNEDIETWISTGTVYDLKGQSIGRVENMVGVLFNDKYFTMGEEYYQLVNLEGDVLIDESKKITDTESINIRKSGGLIDKSNRTLIKIKYRENAQNVEPKEALLNLETLEMVDLQDVLNTAP